MNSALLLGQIDAHIKNAANLIKSGDPKSGIRELQETHSIILDEEKNCDSDLRTQLIARRERCAQAIFCEATAAPPIRSQPMIRQPILNQRVDIGKLIMPNDNSVFLRDIIGMEDVKLAFIQAILLPKASKIPSDFQWKGLLLYGPSGVGKSRIVKAFVNSVAMTANVKITFLNITMDQVCGSFHGETEKNLSAIFEAAKQQSPTVLLCDEIDALCVNRNKLKNESEVKMANHFLSVLDGITGKAPIVLIGTTNRVDSMDTAFYRRFHKMMYIGLPTKQERETILRSFVSRVQPNNGLVGIDFAEIAERTYRYSPSDLSGVIANALQNTRSAPLGREILQQMETGTSVDIKKLVAEGMQFSVLSTSDLLTALEHTTATNEEADLLKLERFAETHFGSVKKFNDIKSDCDFCSIVQMRKDPVDTILDGIAVICNFFFS